MQVSIRWIENPTFLAESDLGHSVIIDGPESEGGRNTGIRPMEMMLMGIGGCTSFDVIKIFKKAPQPVESCIVRIEAKRSGDVPSVFTGIHLHFLIKAEGIKESQVNRARELSAEKYCSASIMLERGGVNIAHDYEILEAHSG